MNRESGTHEGGHRQTSGAVRNLDDMGAGLSSARDSTRSRRGQAADIRRARQGGVSGTLRGGREVPFPHAAAIERATVHAVPGTAVVDEALAEQGVAAYTEGTRSVFASARPDLAVAAHEASHQYQHAGIIRGGGIDPEVQAEAIAEGVCAGRVDPGLMPEVGAQVSARPRAYTEIDEATQKARKQWDVGSLARVGDEGRTVTTKIRHECYAEPSLLDEANGILRAKKSGIELSSGGKTISGDAPDGSGRKTVSDVRVQIPTSTAAPGDPQDFWMDCGRSSREVMGPSGGDAPPRAVYDDGAGSLRETGGAYSPQTLRDEVFVNAGLGPDADTARKAYFALSAADRETFDQQHGINRYAAPGVGQAHVAARHDEALQPGDAGGFNFHWGGVIMVAGPDRVTFENFAKAGSRYDDKDAKWYFETYGPPSKPGQTFHDQNQGSVGGDVSDENVTLATTNAQHDQVAGRMSTRELIRRLDDPISTEERTMSEDELKSRHVSVEVESVTGGDWGDGEVRVRLEAGGTATRESDIGQGATHRFLFPLKDLWPLGSRISVSVVELDLLFDDAVLESVWTSPFARVSRDGEGYRVTIDFDQ